MSGSNILHFGAIRLRVVGVGTLRPSFRGFHDTITDTLVPLTLSTTNARKMDRLSNYQGQSGKLKLETTALNEYMRVNDITIYVKELWSQYPG